ncbi:hypothetical protein [Priestia megaterium]|uniref:hypothetical protein n=1 Tax=Priestia megaterium TaxID=1404 RepID=UPI0014556F84|nr:hypothetical protein [Priestia megaterium]
MILSEKVIISRLWDLAVSDWKTHTTSAMKALELMFDMFVPPIEEMDTSFLESPEEYYVEEIQTDEEHYRLGLSMLLSNIIEEALKECTIDDTGEVENKTQQYEVLLDEIIELLTQWKFYLSENRDNFQ